MASTYTPIATQTLGSAAASVTFSSIPSTYTDIIAVISSGATAGNDIRTTINSDTGTNYSITSLYGDGSSAGSTRTTSQVYLYSNAIGNSTTTGAYQQTYHFMNYSNTSTYKTVLFRTGRGDSAASFPGTSATVGLWRSTAAISTIKFDVSGTFNAGSTFTLYGIKAA